VVVKLWKKNWIRMTDLLMTLIIVDVMFLSAYKPKDDESNHPCSFTKQPALYLEMSRRIFFSMILIPV